MGFAVVPGRWALVLGVVVLAVIAVPDLFAAAFVAAPAPLVGTWKRTVTKKEADVPGNDVDPGLACKAIIARGGTFTLDCPGWGHYTAVITSAKADRIKLKWNIFGVIRMTYRWHVASNGLTLKKVEDEHGNTEAILPGVWKHA